MVEPLDKYMVWKVVTLRDVGLSCCVELSKNWSLSPIQLMNESKEIFALWPKN